MANNGAQEEVCRVGVKVPPFWPNEPALWFVQLEGQFALSNITADGMKFYHVIANLDYKYVCEVKDVITNPPAENKYEKIKTELISRLSASQEQRVRQLLTHEELGDRKPSQFLRHLRSLAGAEVPDEFIRSLWTNRLPSHVQAIIAAQADLPLDTVAQIVDKIHEVSLQPQVAATSTSTSTPSGCPTTLIEKLVQRVDDLSRQVAELSIRSRSRSRSRARSPRWRRRSRSRSNAGSGHCWYHRRFGNQSTKCRSPCSFHSGNEPSSQ
ncbi:uncharacterized protein LOC124541975 [Vanessa cardui]|uniref:uncharacterized protein LOC124541975 n=1 Tax=Vanessa cardui TaxID=171605 RepID=UPI001F133397|nr:uncharacterized protein LOC124541975 [Vanessa cardui]